MKNGYNWDRLWCLLLGLLGMVLQSLLVWLCWKWFIFSLFPVPELTYLQALGIVVCVPVARRLIDIPTQGYDMSPNERLKLAWQMNMALVDIGIVVAFFKIMFFI